MLLFGGCRRQTFCKMAANSSFRYTEEDFLNGMEPQGEDHGERTEDDDEGESSNDEELTTTADNSEMLAMIRPKLNRQTKRKAGRKSAWPEETTDDLVDIICEDEYLRKKIIFTNNKNTKNSEVYQKVLKQLKERCQQRGETCEFSHNQARNKFKSLIAICKKASLTRQTASGIENFIQKQGYGKWFGQLFPLVQSRESAQPEQAIEPSESLDQDCDKENAPTIYVPRKKRKSKETEKSALTEAVQKFNDILQQDPTEPLIKFFKEENDQFRQHEERMMQLQMNMQMQMMQMMMKMGNQTGMPSYSQGIDNSFGPSYQFNRSFCSTDTNSPKMYRSSSSTSSQSDLEKSYYQF